MKAKFIIEAANHPTDPEADEVEPSILCNNQEDNQFGNFFFPELLPLAYADSCQEGSSSIT